jgi:cytosine/adenosine deaminase-related metal-dependent hydrolase
MYAPVAATLRDLIQARGGFVNAHSHLDIAYSIDLPGLRRRLASYVDGDVTRAGELPLRTKIDEIDLLLRSDDEHAETIGQRVRTAVAGLREQGGRAIRSCVTVGTELGTGPLEEVARIRDELAPEFTMQLVALPLRELAAAELNHFGAVCKSAAIDVVGALPQNDPDEPERYFDRVLELAAALDKPVEAHVDEYLRADEQETLALGNAVLRARAAGYERRVSAVHAVTLAAWPPDYRARTAELLARAEVDVVICPRAALSMQALETATYLHNAIAPVRDLVGAGVNVALGTDNIRDVFMPLGGGDLLAEIELLAEAARLFDLELLADLASTGGARALGLPR